MPAPSTNKTSNANNNNEKKNNILMLFMRADGMKSKATATSNNKKSNLLGAADSFYEITNARGQVVATSAVLYNDKTPKWAPIKLNMEALCDNDEHQSVTISFYDYHHADNGNSHDLIGTVMTSVFGLKKSAEEYRNQPKHVATLADSKASHEFGEWVRLFIYDVILISTTAVTTPTTATGTMITIAPPVVELVEHKAAPVVAVPASTPPQTIVVVGDKKTFPVSIASTIDTNDDDEMTVDSLLNLEIIVIHDEEEEYRQYCGAISLPAYIAA